jgi:DNA-binding MarR family transcriptional regulator
LKGQNIDIILEQGISVDSCTCGELRKAARAVTLLYDNACKASGLQSTQLHVLDVVYRSDSISISHLAKELGLDRTTLTRNLSVLEREGFIKISPGEDNRTRVVTITHKGRTAIAKAIPLWNEVQRKVRQRMGEPMWNELMNNLSQFVKVADQINKSG